MSQAKLISFGGKNLLDRYEHALLLSAVGDSLGWPLEFRNIPTKERIETFKTWKKLVGGKWWGYEDEILSGEYSDDTQLTLSVARSIDTDGNFDPIYFAYLELILWLNYERGGGKSVKKAARNLVKKNVRWNTNFYKTNEVDYFSAGANGAAMRNLPIAMVNLENEKRFIQDTIKNSIITHGHPRALIGSLLIGAAQTYTLKEDEINTDHLLKYVNYILTKSFSNLKENKEINNWMKSWKNNSYSFEEEYKITLEEAMKYLLKISNYLHKDEREFYELVKAKDPKFKGSGLSTTIVALYMFCKHIDTPEIAIFNAVNNIGSDTDTIASFIGSLIGASKGKGISSQLNQLINQLQDKEYFEKMALNLFSIYQGKNNIIEITKSDKNEIYLEIMAWEIGLHELFWEALSKGDPVMHPSLGRGIIEYKIVKNIKQKKDYVAKIFKIKFDSGQTAYFHSRVSDKDVVQESLAKEMEKFIWDIKIS